MARVPLTEGAYNAFSDDGTDLTTLTYDTMVLGVDNGVEVDYGTEGLIALYNDGVGAALYTFKAQQPTNLQNLSMPVADKDYSVGIGLTLLVKFNSAFRQADNKIFIDCDVAGKIAVVK